MTKNSGLQIAIEAFEYNKNLIAKAFVALYPFMKSADCFVQNYSRSDKVMLDLLFIMACGALDKISY
jgi:hypothetical protein